MTLITEETKQRLLKSIPHYLPEEFDLFMAELGWEDWMNDYTTAAEDELISEAEANKIDSDLLDIWMEYWQSSNQLLHPEEFDPYLVPIKVFKKLTKEYITLGYRTQEQQIAVNKKLEDERKNIKKLTE